MKQVDFFKIDEEQKITMRDLEEIFTAVGYELSKIQMNDLYMEMEAGRKFNRTKF
jgi:hypothetical protein